MVELSLVDVASQRSGDVAEADEYGPHGIRINNVLTGLTKDDPGSVPAEWTSGVPLGRAQSTAELARVVRFLAGEQSAYVTGQNLRVDGGATRSV